MKQLGVFAKYWEPGRVKTRLAATLGDGRASEIYRLFVDTTLARFGRHAERSVVCYWPLDRRQAFTRYAPGWELQPQCEGDLGMRMQEYFVQAFSGECERAVLLGSDSPNLPVEYVERAFQSLQSHDIVLGPSDDGGYYLVGARGQVPKIFQGVDWSTPRVWEQTLDQVEQAGLSYSQLPGWYDVDDIEDLSRLQADLVGTDDRLLSELANRMDDVLRTFNKA